MFHEELTDAPPFDPDGYLVAVDKRTGRYVGLVRFWRNPTGPRLGLLGVLPEFRIPSLAAGLLEAGLTGAADQASPKRSTRRSRVRCEVIPIPSAGVMTSTIPASVPPPGAGSGRPGSG